MLNLMYIHVFYLILVHLFKLFRVQGESTFIKDTAYAWLCGH